MVLSTTIKFKFTQEAVEEDEGSSYQSMGDVSQGDNNVDALDMVDDDEGDGKVEGEGDKEGQANDEGQMDPFQVTPYFSLKSYHI